MDPDWSLLPAAGAVTVLLVDDDRIHSRIFENRLKAEGYRIISVNSGEDALMQARICQPTVIICDWLMEGMDGLQVCRAVKSDHNLQSTHFILLSSRSRVEDRVAGLDCGADDFLSKPINAEELLARVRSGIRLNHATNQLQRLAEELTQQKRQLDEELAEAAGYVQSLLPTNLTDRITVESCFVPCNQLGGDAYDYFWFDDDHFIVYLADASGHGLAAAFPSISLHNQLRSRTLPVDLRDPAQVLTTLNRAFQMEDQQGRYLTMWYGVFQRSTRTLRFATAGHPPALLCPQDPDEPMRWLRSQGMALGLFAHAQYINEVVAVERQSSLFVYSDGIYEIPRVDGSVGTLAEFMTSVEANRVLLTEAHDLTTLIGELRAAGNGGEFSDDYSLIKAVLH